MANENGDKSSTSTGEQIVELLNDLTKLRDRAEAATLAAEEANRKANSESGFAFNAKQNAEDHARAISQVRGTVDADFNWLTTTKANAEELTQAIGRAKASSENDAQAAANARAAAAQDSSAASLALGGAERIHAAITKLQVDVGTVVNRVTEEAASITQAKTSSEAGAAVIHSLQSEVTEAAAKVESESLTIAKREAESQALLQSITDVVATARAVQERVTEYETMLGNLQKEFNSLHSKTESLLPGATSAGLASAFRDQKSRFDQPQRNWLYTFVVAMTLLLIAGFVGLPGFRWTGPVEPTSWDTILRHLVNRLPLVAPLVWLGIYAGRNYMLALRMQEEYAFKEAISATFEGYKREMAGIEGAEATVAPLMTLCENVLLTLAQRPGRIYEAHQEDITPLAPLTKVLTGTLDQVVDKIPVFKKE